MGWERKMRMKGEINNSSPQDANDDDTERYKEKQTFLTSPLQYGPKLVIAKHPNQTISTAALPTGVSKCLISDVGISK
jgi:hypothetical protein